MTEDKVLEKTKENERKVFIIEVVPGMRIKLMPVAQSLMRDVVSRYKPPEPPIWTDPDTGNEMPNPADPNYKRELEEMSRKQNAAVTDTWLQFGTELLDPLPPLDTWMPKLRILEKEGHIDLSEYNIDDGGNKNVFLKLFYKLSGKKRTNSAELEYLYKKYIIGTASVMSLVAKYSNVIFEVSEQSEEMFRS